ncbi:uncharacterized protein KQ657_003700 [Scheffersomyces spartinae]|uniref:Uncharacterized protein n=1 Tax=Scheffersomyces spartinae TaxID=45513 RepID=A0A9P7VBS8_9ASCO|nr:uncharacterized protein KQ657_003700 [Scheffersomyces spartinae]KAG7195176.1 hypothetical protein KQ657_003700 [Scheffersomyces spartinae]
MQIKFDFFQICDIDDVFFNGYVDCFDISVFEEDEDAEEDVYGKMIDAYGIIYFDKYFFNLFLENKYTSNFNYSYTPHDILRNTDLAMYLYSRNEHVDLCLSRFLLVDFERACKLINKNTFFTFFSFTPKIGEDPEQEGIDIDLTLLDYKQVMLIHYYILLYNQTIVGTIKTEFLEQFDFVEYNILSLLKFLNNKYLNFYFDKLLKNRKIDKLFDITSKKYMYEEMSEVKAISEYEYKCLIYNS